VEHSDPAQRNSVPALAGLSEPDPAILAGALDQRTVSKGTNSSGHGSSSGYSSENDDRKPLSEKSPLLDLASTERVAAAAAAASKRMIQHASHTHPHGDPFVPLNEPLLLAPVVSGWEEIEAAASQTAGPVTRGGLASVPSGSLPPPPPPPPPAVAAAAAVDTAASRTDSRSFPQQVERCFNDIQIACETERVPNVWLQRRAQHVTFLDVRDVVLKGGLMQTVSWRNVGWIGHTR
jgi:hypothetical protein